jgi:hypothetical protein
MADQYTVEDLFLEMSGKEYPSYRELENAVITRFNAHLGDFPPHYSYRDAISWADRKRWLQPHGGRFTVSIRPGTPA